MEPADTERAAPIWARGPVMTMTCPKAYITGESVTYVQLFGMRKRLGFPDARGMESREAEAMLALEREWRQEVKIEQH